MINIKERLIFHEGKKNKPYLCTAGKKTQGVGHNLDNNPLPQSITTRIINANCWTDNEIDMVLSYDICECEKQLVNMIKCYSWLDAERKYALLDMCFQLGITTLLKFKKMIQALETKDYEKPSLECLDSKYHKDTPKRCERIANLIKTGEWKI